MAKKTWNQTLEQLRYGTLHDELTDKLNEAVEASTRTNKVAKIGVVLTLKPGKSGQLEIVDDVKLSLPEEEKGSTIMFATPENNLIREDPRQLKIEGLRTVDRDTGEIRSVQASEGGELRKVG